MKITSLPSSQQRAYHSKSPYYYTGNPCINGHLSPRRTVDYKCTACLGLSLGDLADRQIISRRLAQAEGLKTYYTGKPCLRGHISERRTDSCACCECLRENNGHLPDGFTVLRLKVRSRNVKLIQQIAEDLNK